MLFIHEVHAVTAGRGESLETLLREQWAPAVARDDGARLVWCARSMPGAISFPEVITLTAVIDGAALERMAARRRIGDLRKEMTALTDYRVGVTSRILAPLAFNPLEIELDAIPPEPEPVDKPSEIYVHDFVPPRLGMQRAYEKAMQQVFMAMLDMEGIEVRIWAGLETLCGGGPSPETLNISRISTAAAAIGMLSRTVSRDDVKPGSWMYEGLKLRDTWTSRLVRTVPWSPIR